MYLQLLTAATAANGAPSLITDGFALRPASSSSTIDIAGDRGLLLLKSTAGSSTMSVTIRLWGYSAISASWLPLGVGGASTKGIINGGNACGETGTDAIAHAEVIGGLENLQRIYAEITNIGGTSTAISAWLVARL